MRQKLRASIILKFTQPQVYISITLALIMLICIQDYVRSTVNSSAFYFSESFIFSSFWWMFIPGLMLLLMTQPEKRWIYFTYTAGLILTHLLLFGVVVWSLSSVFLDHTYNLSGVLTYGLAEHTYQLVLIYGIVSLILFINRENANQSPESYPLSIMVNDGRRSFHIKTEEINRFTACPPYIALHHKGNTYLIQGTLRKISQKLNPQDFVRIHRSTIINLKMISSLASRQNGDYDLQMSDGTEVRLSRSFAGEFKHRFQSTPLTAK